MTCWPRLAYKNKFWSQYIPWQFSNKWYWQNRYETCSDSLLNSIILCSWQVCVSFEAWKRQKIVQTPIQPFLLTTFQRTDNSVPKHQASYTGWIAFTGRFIIFLPWTPTDTTAQTIHTYLIQAHDSLCHVALYGLMIVQYQMALTKSLWDMFRQRLHSSLIDWASIVDH